MHSVSAFLGGCAAHESIKLLTNQFVPFNNTNRALVITHEANENLTRSARNIPNLQLIYSNSINLKEILLAKHIIITQDALTNITSK